MQKTLTSVAGCLAPSAMQTLGGVPVSLIVVANVFRNAPLLCCRQEVKDPFVQSVSAVHVCGGFSNATVTSGSKQKPQKTRGWAAVLKEVFVCVSVERMKSTGRQPRNVEPDTGEQPEASMPLGLPGGGQSWLVG